MDKVEQEIQEKGLNAPRVTPQDIENEIVAEYFFTASDAIQGATVEEMAQICHEVNRSYCRAINDHSQLSWEETPEHIKESARTGVIMHLLGDVTPEQSHANWMEYKREEGWVYGPEKDVEAKVHPCMVPYNELPLEQQVKDHLFKGVVNSVSKVFSCAPQMATLKLLTFCVLVLRNGFTVTGESACASPENFDAELGRSIARAKAKEKMWPLLGYALKSKLYSK